MISTVKLNGGKNYNLTLNKPNGLLSGFSPIGSVLMLAQAEKYCGKKYNLDGILSRTVDMMLSIDPGHPTVEKLQNIVNGLLSRYSELRVQHVVDNQGLDCWQVNPGEKI